MTKGVIDRARRNCDDHDVAARGAASLPAEGRHLVPGALPEAPQSASDVSPADERDVHPLSSPIDDRISRFSRTLNAEVGFALLRRPRRPEARSRATGRVTEASIAAGDGASHYHPLFGRRIRVEHWNDALRHRAAPVDADLPRDEAVDQRALASNP
ncbi:MAG: hypothetical protein ACRDXD_13170 [Acidimicrobiia bacterium]